MTSSETIWVKIPAGQKEAEQLRGHGAATQLQKKQSFVLFLKSLFPPWESLPLAWFHSPITGLSFTASWSSAVGSALQHKQQAKSKHTEDPALDMNTRRRVEHLNPYEAVERVSAVERSCSRFIYVELKEDIVSTGKWGMSRCTRDDSSTAHSGCASCLLR